LEAGSVGRSQFNQARFRDCRFSCPLHRRGINLAILGHLTTAAGRGEVHTAHIDSSWSPLKRGIMGSYHTVSKKYLPLYISEFALRHNNRRNEDIFALAIAER